MDKYGAGQDPYCYPESSVLLNLLNLRDERQLAQAESEITTTSASEIDFALPPYDLHYLQELHRRLFGKIYPWAGELRHIDISKGTTRFCTSARIRPEADKLFRLLEGDGWLEGSNREELVKQAAIYYGDMNVIHPFREGNGRAQRLLFEHLVINAGFEISWQGISQAEWIQANIDAVTCNYQGLVTVFDKCIGTEILGVE